MAKRISLYIITIVVVVLLALSVIFLVIKLKKVTWSNGEVKVVVDSLMDYPRLHPQVNSNRFTNSSFNYLLLFIQEEMQREREGWVASTFTIAFVANCESIFGL